MTVPGRNASRAVLSARSNLRVICVANFFVGFSVRSRHWHFSLFGGAKIESSAAKKRKKASNLRESPTEMIVTQARVITG